MGRRGDSGREINSSLRHKGDYNYLIQKLFGFVCGDFWKREKLEKYTKQKLFLL